MDAPSNETPEAVKSLLATGLELLATHGWTVLFFLIVINLIWSHFYPKYRKWREQVENQEREAEYKKDPSLIIAREEAMALARQRLQEKHLQISQERAQQIKEREDAKKKEKIENLESILYKKHKNDSTQKPDSNLRPNHNPLMGYGGGSSGYRPIRRGNTGGG